MRGPKRLSPNLEATPTPHCMGDPHPDYYVLLGVMPDAEDIVVTAAYRALAQRYHPDRWSGNPSEAHRRMTEVNAAYAVLSDPVRRAEYNRTYRKQAQSRFQQSDLDEEAFQSAMTELNARWEIARSVYADLTSHTERLQRISTSLAFAYMTVLLGEKHFDQRKPIAERMEQRFLERFFGTSPPIVDYARKLIFAGQKEAAKALNVLVDVVGSGADPTVLVNRIEQQFDLKTVWDKQRAEAERKDTRARLVRRALASSDYPASSALADFLGYKVEAVGNGLFRPMRILTVTPTGDRLEFDGYAAFIVWVKSTLCKPDTRAAGAT